MSNETYLFLADEIYSPKQVSLKYGSPVKIDKRDRDEIWFSVLKSNIKGYVVYPNLFVLNTKENKKIIAKFRKDIALSEKLKNNAFKSLEKIPTL